MNTNHLHNLEHRLSALEKEVQLLRQTLSGRPPLSSGHQLVDYLGQHPELQEVFAQAKKLRAKDRAAARRRQPVR